MLSPLAQLTLQWIEAVLHPDYEGLEETRNRLKEYLESAGNTRHQIQYWFDYSVELGAYEDGERASVVETEVIIARMQGHVK